LPFPPRAFRIAVQPTFPHLDASIAVLRKLGFAPSERSEPGVLAFALRRPR
jgi:hypothetical protein